MAHPPSDDVLGEILLYADIPTLCHAAFLSRRTHHVIQRALYRHIRVSASRAALVLATLAANPDLGALVHGKTPKYLNVALHSTGSQFPHVSSKLRASPRSELRNGLSTHA